ncbi:MAG: SPOR domain-containing protein [Pyrinomonadaceae bacterium]
MKAICPNCSAENSHDADAAANSIGVVCAVCAMTYEAISLGDESLTFPVEEHESLATWAASGDPQEASAATTDEVLLMPEAAISVASSQDESLVLEDVFNTHSASTKLTAAPIPAEAVTFDGSEVEELRPRRVVARDVAINPDNYAVGVRLLHIAPVWLLLGGISFVSIITLGSWLRPNGQAEVFANPVRQNQAMNLAREATPAPLVAVAASNRAESAVVAKEPERPKPAPVAKVEQKETVNAEDGKYLLQVASYSDASQANAQASTLRAAGFEARVVPVELEKRGMWYRVQSGNFGTREAASQYLSQLRARGVAANAIVVGTGK